MHLQELACVDLSMEIAERCLEVVRGSVEAAAARERDEAAARLLSELELEDASKKVAYTLWPCLLGESLSTCPGCSVFTVVSLDMLSFQALERALKISSLPSRACHARVYAYIERSSMKRLADSECI